MNPLEKKNLPFYILIIVKRNKNYLAVKRNRLVQLDHAIYREDCNPE